jgi:hypothetical protein
MYYFVLSLCLYSKFLKQNKKCITLCFLCVCSKFLKQNKNVLMLYSKFLKQNKNVFLCMFSLCLYVNYCTIYMLGF